MLCVLFRKGVLCGTSVAFCFQFFANENFVLSLAILKYFEHHPYYALMKAS